MSAEPPVAILDAEPHSAALNMALDEALLLSARTPVLRRYHWVRPAVSFGYFGKHAVVSAMWPERELVRRMTGGGVVPHGEDITYTLVVPAGHGVAEMSARESYQFIHGCIGQWLAGHGRATTLAGETRERGNGVCFESAVEADVIEGDRKLAGAAQRRTREGLLVQGSVQEVPAEWASDLPIAFGAVETRDFTEEERDLAERLVLEKYGTHHWMERV